MSFADSKRLAALAEFDENGSRVLYKPVDSSETPNPFRWYQLEDASSTDEEMPGALCGWCHGPECNSLILLYCLTWNKVRSQLTLEMPRHLRR